MKTLTKPEKFRTAFPSIYGYEDDKSSWVKVDSTTVKVGDPVICVTKTTYYECQAGGSDYCTIGATKSNKKTWGPC